MTLPKLGAYILGINSGTIIPQKNQNFLVLVLHKILTFAYLAIFTARVSRMTVTFTCPG